MGTAVPPTWAAAPFAKTTSSEALPVHDGGAGL
eukprot:CAMPEP_0195061926 /NCGR_PEP_ID=MMETSP0448-20130528/8676_1 /TAXON_ID=66468 /ORGANISM="Heterocapsa triquestra, Strain CCMP 448" /LENGTH=32 /DNA_ID= /DNA_START= /DNA_END= /DNA_ORIENTATION=